MVSDKKFFSYFPYISLCKACDPQRRSHFGPQVHNLNKRGGGPLDDAASKYIKALALVVSDKKTFSCFPYKSLCKPVTHRGRPIFSPRGII